MMQLRKVKIRKHKRGIPLLTIVVVGHISHGKSFTQDWTDSQPNIGDAKTPSYHGVSILDQMIVLLYPLQRYCNEY